MTKYRVELAQTVTEACSIEVEADTQVEAEDLAVARAEHGKVTWTFYEAHDGIEVIRSEIVS